MACLLSTREVEELENESDDFARSRRQRGRPPARGDDSETDVLPKGYLFGAWKAACHFHPGARARFAAHPRRPGDAPSTLTPPRPHPPKPPFVHK
jgi:hypothetical protein